MLFPLLYHFPLCLLTGQAQTNDTRICVWLCEINQAKGSLGFIPVAGSLTYELTGTFPPIISVLFHFPLIISADFLQFGK